jgi:hypothetical protein
MSINKRIRIKREMISENKYTYITKSFKVINNPYINNRDS